MTLQEMLTDADKRYSPELCLLGGKFKGPGYHSLVKEGTWTHGTRDSIYYAIQLFRSRQQDNIERAKAILQKIISLQDTNLYNPTYGIWSWVYEEPLEKMSPPDWNWADFIGAALAHILIQYKDDLSEQLFQNTLESIGHAAWSIFRRNVQPGYTNIAIMGVVVTAVAGELRQEKRLVDYARLRLKMFYDHTVDQGGLNEYNSPCYTFVALHEIERIIQLVDDAEINDSAEKIRLFIWDSLANHYHPVTKQLAGPHSRSYSDLLSQANANYINWAVSNSQDDYLDLNSIHDVGTHLPCPEQYRQRFVTLPSESIIQKDRFIKHEIEEKSFYGTTWMTDDVALGSINYESFWVQRRPFIGYWLDADNCPAVLRLRMLKDGRDFASAGMCSFQENNKILTGIKMYSDLGDYHIHLDRSKDGIYKISNLKLRYELTGCDSAYKQLTKDQFELSAGNWKAVISTTQSLFNDQKITWQIGKENQTVYLEAVLYDGIEQEFSFDENMFTKLVLATELLKKDEKSSNQPINVSQDQSTLHVSWQVLSLNYNPYCDKYS